MPCSWWGHNKYLLINSSFNTALLTHHYHPATPTTFSPLSTSSLEYLFLAGHSWWTADKLPSLILPWNEKLAIQSRQAQSINSSLLTFLGTQTQAKVVKLLVFVTVALWILINNTLGKPTYLDIRPMLCFRLNETGRPKTENSHSGSSYLIFNLQRMMF